jgi:hypothetical protein
VLDEDTIMITNDAYEEGTNDTRHDFTTNDFRITRVLDSLLISARSITGDTVIAADITGRVQTLRHLLKEVGHDV